MVKYLVNYIIDYVLNNFVLFFNVNNLKDYLCKDVDSCI